MGEIVVGIAFLIPFAALAFSFFFSTGAITRRVAKRKGLLSFFTVILFGFLLIGEGPRLFLLTAVPGYLVGRLSHASDAFVRRSILFNLIGGGLYVFIEVILESQVLEFPPLDQLFSSDLVYFRFPEVVLTSTVTVLAFVVILVLLWASLGLLKNLSGIPAFMLGAFVGMLIAYFPGMKALGIPWEDKWHWFDAVWWRSRVLLLVCIVVGVVSGGMAMALAEVLERKNTMHASLLLSVGVAYLIEPQLHFRIQHPYWIHNPFYVPVFIIAILFGCALSRIEAFRSMFWAPSFTSRVRAICIIFFIYHGILETFEMTSWPFEIQDGVIMLLVACVTMPLGIMVGRSWEAIKEDAG